MAPERFRGDSDGRSDVYALGATLYEMLTLQPAFEGDNQLELIHRIEQNPPVPPRHIDGWISRDLETIVLKALAKNPAERFAGAAEMAQELRLYLDNRPIRSRPIPSYQRFWRWCKRNPWLAAANVAAALLTTILAIGSTIAAWTYRDQVEALQLEQRKTRLAQQGLADQLVQTQDAETKGRERLFESLDSQAQARRLSRRMGQRFGTLDALEQAAKIARDLKWPTERLEPLRDEAIACLALPDLKPTGRAIPWPPGTVAVAFDSTMTRYALRFRGGTISMRRVADGQEIAQFQARGDREISVFRFCPYGRYLATYHDPGHGLTVWDVDRRVVTLNDPGPVSWGIYRFSPDGTRIILAHQGGEFRVYDLVTGRLEHHWTGSSEAHAVAFRPDGLLIALTCREGNASVCRIVEAESGSLVRRIPLPFLTLSSIDWSPDGSTLAIPCEDRKIYLYDAATGTRRATLEGHINGGLFAAFHPAGTLLASHGWEGRVWLWDPVLGRPWLTLTGSSELEFSRDGRIVVSREGTQVLYQVDPALEYRTFAHASIQRFQYLASAIRHDGRVLAVATSRGVMLWDLARGSELAFLPVGLTWDTLFEASGALLTSGAIGVRRWPIELDPDRGIFRIDPPRQLPFPPAGGAIAEDRSGRIVAQAQFDLAFIATPERTTPVGPLDDCRDLTVSPDGEWLATGSHAGVGQVWRVRDAAKVKDLSIGGVSGLSFSPDGKWLMSRAFPCRLWEVGTWREASLKFGGEGKCFFPDGRLLVVQDASRIIRLVETETGRTVARLESPDLCDMREATFSPDGSRLVSTTNDGPAVHVWDLRAIRRHLARIGLDWDAPAYSDDDPASPALPPLLPVQVELGPSPLTWQPDPRFYEHLIADLETALARQPDQRRIRGLLANYCNNFAWSLITAPGSTHDSQRALSLARRAVEMAPGRSTALNTLGLAQYRAGQFAEAIVTLEKSLAAAKGESDAFDLFFLAMARYRLGRAAEARADFECAVRWRRDHPNLRDPSWSRELDEFQAEAQAVLNAPPDELPANVFAGEREEQL
jgi:WD40 repeat protein